MGLDLKLLPFEADNDAVSFSHSILNCSRDYELFDNIKEIEPNNGPEVPDNFYSFVSRDDAYCDSHYGLTTSTPYGEKLTYIKAIELLNVELPKDVSQQNKAVWAYLKELPPDTKIALYWC